MDDVDVPRKPRARNIIELNLQGVGEGQILCTETWVLSSRYRRHHLYPQDSYCQYKVEPWVEECMYLGLRARQHLRSLAPVMKFGDLVGLKLPDIRLTSEEKPRKKPHPGNLSRLGIEPGPAA